jgi:hypothetical protein
MINFNRDHDPRKDGFLAEKLQALLDQIEDMTDDHSPDNLNSDQKSLNTDISKIISIIYVSLFTEPHDSITLTVSKNPNNSLDLKILDIE